MQISNTPSVLMSASGKRFACTYPVIGEIHPIRIRKNVTNGVAKSRYGIRLPRRVRVRSLAVERIGFITKFIAAGTLPTTRPINAPEAPKCSSVSGSSVGTRLPSIPNTVPPRITQADTTITSPSE